MTVRINVDVLGTDDNAEQLERDTAELCSELLLLDVQDVGPVSGGPPPPGTRSVDVAMVGSLLVTVLNDVDAVRKVVLAVRGWLSRSGGKYSAELVLGKDKLVVTGIDKTTQDQLIDAWLRAHDLER